MKPCMISEVFIFTYPARSFVGWGMGSERLDLKREIIISTVLYFAKSRLS